MIEYDATDDGNRAALGQPSVPIKIRPVAPQVEHLKPATFNQWTDGLKIVFDTSCGQYNYPNNVTVISGTLIDAIRYLKQVDTTIPTYYYIGLDWKNISFSTKSSPTTN